MREMSNISDSRQRKLLPQRAAPFSCHPCARNFISTRRAFRIPEDDQVHIERSHRYRPDDAPIVVMLFGDQGEQPI
jgi:hypothetical protein